MDGDGIFGANQIRAGGGLLQVHVIDAVGGEKGVIQLPGCKGLHLPGGGGIAGGVEGNPIHRDDIADAGIPAVVFVVRLHGLYRHALGLEGVVAPALQGIPFGDDFAVRLFDWKANLVVVAVLVGDENQVGGQIIALPGKGVDVDDHPVRRDDSIAAVSLIKQCGHRAFLL